jgi:hypothetical protein
LLPQSPKNSIIDTLEHKVNGEEETQDGREIRTQSQPKTRKDEGTKEKRVFFDLVFAGSFWYVV